MRTGVQSVLLSLCLSLFDYLIPQCRNEAGRPATFYFNYKLGLVFLWLTRAHYKVAPPIGAIASMANDNVTCPVKGASLDGGGRLDREHTGTADGADLRAEAGVHDINTEGMLCPLSLTLTLVPGPYYRL